MDIAKSEQVEAGLTRLIELFTGAEWAFVRQHEAEIVEYLKMSDSGGQGSAS